MNEKDKIEQLKRDLKSYGYYMRCIISCESDLYNITQQLRDCYEVSGISYDSPMGSSDPQHPRVAMLCNEEADILLKIKEYKKDIVRLNLDDKIESLSKL